MPNFASAKWLHDDMKAPFSVSGDYTIETRSGDSLTLSVSASASLLGSDSYYNYDIYAKVTTNGVSNTIKLKDSTEFKSGETCSGATSFSFNNIGREAGTLNVSVLFYSTTDKNSCGVNGTTVYGLIPYASTNTKPDDPTVNVNPSTPSEVITLVVNRNDPENNQTKNHIVMAVLNDDGSLYIDGQGKADYREICNYDNDPLGWQDNNGKRTYIINLSQYWGDEYRGKKFAFCVKSKDIYNAVSSNMNPSDSKDYSLPNSCQFNRKPHAITSIKADEYVQDIISITWNTNTPPDPDNQVVHFAATLFKSDGSVFKEVSKRTDITTNTVDFNISSYACNDVFKVTVYPIDELNVSGPTIDSGIIKKIDTPVAPNTLAIKQSICNNRIDLEWVTPSGNSVQSINNYELQLKKKEPDKQWSDWTPLTYVEQVNTFKYNSAGDVPGTQYSFRIRSVYIPQGYTQDKGFKSSWSNESSICTKDTPSLPPTDVITCTVNDEPRRFFKPNDIIRVRWKQGVQTTQDNIPYVYKIQYKKMLDEKVIQDWVYVPGTSYFTTTNIYYDFTMPQSDARGTKYLFRICQCKRITWLSNLNEQNYDLGIDSEYGTCDFAQKNLTIDAPDRIVITPDNVDNYIDSNNAYFSYENEINISWGALTSDKKITYNLYVRKRMKGSEIWSDWNLFKEKFDGNNTKFDCSNEPRGMQFNFAVKTFDGLEFSDYQVSTLICSKNLLPTAPILAYPKQGAIVFNLRPTILIKINKDEDYQKQILYVTWNGKQYNSKANANLFSKTIVKEGDQITFKPDVDGIIGINKIIINTNDNYVMSDNIESTVEIKEISPSNIKTGETILDGSIIDFLRYDINIFRKSYGMPTYEFNINKDAERFCTMDDIQSLRLALTEVIYFIDKWDESNAKSSNVKWTDLKTKGEFNFSYLTVHKDNSTFVIDNTEPNILYTSQWERRNNTDGKGKTCVLSSEKGASISYKFNETGIVVYANTNKDSGYIKVTLDNISTLLDLCSSNEMNNRIIFSKFNLSKTTHDLSIEIIGGSPVFICKDHIEELIKELKSL